MGMSTANGGGGERQLRLVLNRRAFLQALGFACAVWLRPIATRLTALADDFDWLMRWCSCSAGPRFAGAG